MQAADLVAHPILLYDGVCGLCNRLVQFILLRDRNATFRFASLQSGLAARILTRHNADPRDLDTVYVVINPEAGAPTDAGERLLARSDAVLFVLQKLGGMWAIPGFLLRLVPRPIRDWAYGQVARNRYRIFGRYDACPLPNAKNRDRFLDV